MKLDYVNSPEQSCIPVHETLWEIMCAPCLKSIKKWKLYCSVSSTKRQIVDMQLIYFSFSMLLNIKGNAGKIRDVQSFRQLQLSYFQLLSNFTWDIWKAIWILFKINIDNRKCEVRTVCTMKLRRHSFISKVKTCMSWLFFTKADLHRNSSINLA